MKYKILLIPFFFIFMIFSLQAQHRGGSFNVEEFKKTRAEYIIKEVGLTEAEAVAFIPLVDELMDKRFELNHSLRVKSRQIRDQKDRNDADYIELVDLGLDIRIKEAELDKEYYQKFKKVLSPEKIYKFQRAEARFMKDMLNTNKRKNKK